MGDPYDDSHDLLDDHRGDESEVAIVVRKKDGTETDAAVFHDATFSLLTATDVDQWITTRHGPKAIPRVIHQLRITSTTGYTVFDRSFFETREEIADG